MSVSSYFRSDAKFARQARAKGATKVGRHAKSSVAPKKKRSKK